MKTLLKLLRYKAWIITLVVMLFTANLFTVAYADKYWKTNREAYEDEVLDCGEIRSNIVSSMCYLMMQDMGGKKNIQDTLSSDEIKQTYLKNLETDRQYSKSIEINDGYMYVKEWLEEHPTLVYYVKNDKTGNVITNSKTLFNIEIGDISNSIFKDDALFYQFHVKGTACSSDKLRGRNVRLGNNVVKDYEEYQAATMVPYGMQLSWIKTIMPELAENEGYTFYFGVKNIRTLNIWIMDVDPEYDLFALLWFYCLELLVLIIGRVVFAHTSNKYDLRYKSFEGVIIGFFLLCILVPMAVILLFFDCYDQSMNYVWSFGLFFSLVYTLYVANILGQIKRKGLKQEGKQKSILVRHYLAYREKHKKRPQNKKKEKLRFIIRLIVEGLLLSGGGTLLFMIAYDDYHYDMEMQLIIVISSIAYLVGIWGIWFIRTIRKTFNRDNAYDVILQQAQAMADGKLDHQITEDLGEFNAFAEALNHINEGLAKAVEEAVTSQSMKTELITNVSHDLKTPLTSIVSYVDLLKRKDLTDQEKMEFVEILEQKSARLKTLIEDLFEMSKAASKDIKLNVTELNVVSLTKEVLVEYEKALDEKNLKVNMSFISENIKVHLDGQKTYRIIANLVGNIVKYTMPHTRVYVTVTKDEEHVILEFKNISATEITHQGKELLERFVREDASRNTEGSGLGLAIARSLAELQNGTLDVEADGDLFKATVTFPLATE